MTNEAHVRNDMDRNEPKYTVSDVTKMVGISKAKLVDYDNKGILCPVRVPKGREQEWRMYSEADLDRLEKIVVLLAYNFRIDEIKLILDEPDVDLSEIVAIRIEELKREEWRLRNLLLFSKFVSITDTEFYEGLIRGPSDIDDFADLVRDSEVYIATIEHLNSLTNEKLIEMFDELDDIVTDYVSTDPELGFAGVEREINRFLQWWKENISVSSELGYLEFWAVFEDDGIIATEVEEIGGEAAAGSLQMAAFYSYMKRLMIDLQDNICKAAILSKQDVVAALDELCKISDVLCQSMGVSSAEDVSASLELVDFLLSCVQRILEDEELIDYLDPHHSITFGAHDITQLRKMLEAIQTED